MLKRLTIGLSVTALVAIGLFGQVVSAAANGGGGGGTGGFHCSGVVTVCVGQINGNTVTVSPSVTVTGNEVSVLENFLNHDSVNVANISDVQTQINVLAVDVSHFLNHSLNVNVCQIKVVEIGLVNTNIANCKQ
jgi:hypothetical protein